MVKETSSTVKTHGTVRETFCEILGASREILGSVRV